MVVDEATLHYSSEAAYYYELWERDEHIEHL